ncbi:hypothetical protein [Streptomyces sp. CMB-StM0423]|uniref:hypothetical protein n=1 Tax=Streptomyces sp. CMB-StM0423 TaxID=2059884 RepID=UPI001F1FB483|nr:hypothetical protein [Streptomyces sp. CMB-StM0423]
MARTRTARILAAAASLPLAVALFGGVAHADNGAGAFANDDSHSAIVGQLGGVGDDNFGNNAQTQQVNNGDGGYNESNTANVQGFGNVVDQSDTVIAFTNIW